MQDDTDTAEPEAIDVNHTEDSVAPDHAPKEPRHHRFFGKIRHDKKLLILSILLLVVLIGAASYGVYRHYHATKPTKTVSKSQAAAKLPPASTLKSNQYLDSPKQLSGISIFKNTDIFGQTCSGFDTTTNKATDCGPSVALSDINYYQIGTTIDGSKIIIIYVPDGEGTLALFALGSSDGTYKLLAQMDDWLVSQKDAVAGSLSSNVSIDLTSKLEDVTFPGSATVKGQKLTNDFGTAGQSTSEANAAFMQNGLVSIRGVFYGDVKDPSTIHKLADVDGLTYYEVIAKPGSAFNVVEIYATYKNLFSVSYKLAGELSSTTDNLPITWTSGEDNSNKYFSGGQGCGSRGYVIGNGLGTTDLIKVGVSKQGQGIYQVAAGSDLAQAIFEDYGTGDALQDSSLKNLSLQQITDKHSYILAQNSFNEYVVFQRDDMFIRGGCGKPVIYLYPAKNTNVSVKVGATITKSDPTYGTNGWQNVLAHPNGQLTYQNRVYSSLFWEGYGLGAYPQITNGTIVPTDQAIKTVRLQLAEQGFKTTEINDFMAFWGPKLASVDKPYIRLSWLDTGQMNGLAPLNISPRPQTLIRTFLDFEGLNQPYSLAPEQFSAPVRQGFTVVEWGGLLHQAF